MKKVLRGIGKWILRIFLGLIGLILVLILVFALFKGRITNKALTLVNEKFPGQAELANFKLHMLRHFPDVSVQLNELSFMHFMDSPGFPDTIPVLELDEIYASVNIIQLLKGSYKVPEVRLGEGEISYIVYGDSISNVELALGMKFGAEPEEEEIKEDSSTLTLYLDDLEISNLGLNYIDDAGSIHMDVGIDELHTGLIYLPELITAALDMTIDLKQVQYQDIILDKERTLRFATALDIDMEKQKVMLDSGIIDLEDALIGLSGDVLLAEDIFLDIQFSAINKGIELLNFLLSGILDMDAIEQIGAGEIELGGEVKGSFGGDLPLITANFRADDLGFHVKALGQDVTEINFLGTATNGTLSDFSEAVLNIDYLHASLPDGEIDLEMKFANLVHPELEMKIDGDLDLSLANEMLDTDAIKDMEGELSFTGDINGGINTSSGEFFDQSDTFNASLRNVNFSLPDNEIRDFRGDLNLKGKDVFLKDMKLAFDGTVFSFDLGLFDIFPHFLGFKTEPSASFDFRCDQVFLDRFITDTSLTNKIEGPIRDVSLSIAAELSDKQLIKVLDGKGIPEGRLSLTDLNIKVPGYAPISQFGTTIAIAGSDLEVYDLKGRIGNSTFGIDLAMINYDAFLENDTASPLKLEFMIASELLKLKEIFTFNDEFIMLPEAYMEEEMHDFIFKGKVETSVGELLKGNGLPEFRFSTDNFRWDLKHYPLPFRDFRIDVEHIDSLIRINTFEGRIGENNIRLRAEVSNLLDSARALSGNLALESDLLDINQLLDYELIKTEEPKDTLQADLLADAGTGGEKAIEADSSELQKKSLGLDAMNIPDFQINIDMKELRYDEINLYGLMGQIRSSSQKIIYLDHFVVESETGGSVIVDGQFNVIDPEAYTLSSSFDIDSLNVSDFKIAFTMGDSVFVLDETFTGILDAEGIAEVYFESSMDLNLAKTTAAFVLSLKDGSLMNFTPLQAAARFTGSKNLNNVKFGEIRNRFTLVDETIYVPLMSINTSLAQLGVEGEQGLDGHFMYLVRIPPALISGTAKNVISGQKEASEGEDEVMGTKSGQYVVLTVSDRGVKPGDRRDKFDDDEVVEQE